MSAPEIGEPSRVEEGALDSYLIEITADVLRKRDATGAPLVDRSSTRPSRRAPAAGPRRSALDLGVPITGDHRGGVRPRAVAPAGARAAAERFPRPRRRRARRERGDIDAIRDALYAAKIVAYAQGFEQMAAAARNTAGA